MTLYAIAILLYGAIALIGLFATAAIAGSVQAAAMAVCAAFAAYTFQNMELKRMVLTPDAPMPWSQRIMWGWSVAFGAASLFTALY